MKFIVGAWMNRRYTRLPSSFILALPMCAFVAVSNFATDTPGKGALVALCVFLLVQILLFPLAREIYFRCTAPMRDGLGAFILPFPLFLIVYLIKVFIHIAIWAFTIPMGIIGFLYLALTERHGRSWRTF